MGWSKMRHDGIEVLPAGRMLVRNVAMNFGDNELR
jgi:hypothetical protein